MALVRWGWGGEGYTKQSLQLLWYPTPNKPTQRFLKFRFSFNRPGCNQVRSAEAYFFTQFNQLLPVQGSCKTLTYTRPKYTILLYWYCNPEQNKFSSSSNTAVVVIFPNHDQWRRTLLQYARTREVLTKENPIEPR